MNLKLYCVVIVLWIINTGKVQTGINIKKILYGVIFILSAINLYRIVRYYLFSPPDTWKLGTKNNIDDMGRLYLPAFSIYLHWWMAAIITVLSLLQILPIFRKREYLIYHRIMGNIYCAAGIIVSIAGNVFIYSNGTVGGFNMSCAFSVYGWLMFYFAIKTYYLARKYNFTKEYAILTDHRAYAIRLWVASISGLNYRLGYLILLNIGYSVTSPNDFYRLLDRIMVWEFFVLPLIINEYYLYRSRIRKNAIV